MIHLMLRAGDAKVLHLVDGDFDAWFYKSRPKRLGTKITATFHQTVDKLPGIVAGIKKGSLDGIVCVSRVQLPFLQQLVPDGRCIFIPHGIDTDFFLTSPYYLPSYGPLLLTVGSHRRDFHTLVAAARIIKAERPDVRFRFIGPPHLVESIDHERLVEVVSNVSDIGLRDAYRECYMLFLPLEAATANNALLESMATGRPAVITDLPAIHDYTSEDAALFCKPSDAKSHADAALLLLNDRALSTQMARVACLKAQEFSWENVRQLFLSFLRNVAP